MNMVLHHIGIACEDIGPALADIRLTHDVLEESGIIHDPAQDANLCLVRTGNGVTFELISGPQVQRFVKNRTTYYHVCYAVNDLDRALGQFTTGGSVICSPPKPAALFGGQRVAFVMTVFGLVELLGSA